MHEECITMKQTTRYVAVLAAMATLTISGAALAHPDHGQSAAAGFGAGFVHPLLGIDHLLAMVAVGIWAAQAGGRVLWAAPLSFVAAMLAGALLGLSGLAVPMIEPMIAASVLVLGLLVATRANDSLRLVPAIPLMALFALFHGVAHGAEFHAFAGGSAPVFMLGFTLATLLLHAAGTGLGRALRGSRIKANWAGAPIAVTGAALLVQAIAA